MQSDVFERIVVRTDGPEIAEVVSTYGSEIPFLRDANMVVNVTPVSTVTLNILLQLDPTIHRYGVPVNAQLSHAKNHRHQRELPTVYVYQCRFPTLGCALWLAKPLGGTG